MGNERQKGGPLSETACEPLADRQRTDEQNASGPLVGTAVGPTTLPPVGRQWAADLLLAGVGAVLLCYHSE